MDEQIKKFFTGEERVSLTADEKSVGRAMLHSFMMLRPMRVHVGRFSFARMMKSAAVSATTLGLLLSAAGVSYAAEGTVPGDTLYPVKVNVNEEVRAAFMTSAKDRADWEAVRAERRLAEAETLASRGHLSAAASTELSARFRIHAENTKRHMAELRDLEDTDGAADVSAHLEGELRAHKKILAVLHDEPVDIGDDNHQNDTKTALATVVAAVDIETTAVIDDRIRVEDVAAKKQIRVGARKNVDERRVAAERKIAQARVILDMKRVSLGVDAAAQAESRLLVAEGFVADGDVKVTANDSAAAFTLYLKAQRTAQEATLLIRAKDGLKIKIDLGDGDDDVTKIAPSSILAPPEEGKVEKWSRSKASKEEKRQQKKEGNDEGQNDERQPREGSGRIDLHIDSRAGLRLR